MFSYYLEIQKKFNYEQLNKNKISYKKEINKPFVNYTFKMANINKIMYYILCKI